ncbi:Pre-mRNA-splicing factor CWC25 [Grifola frondosa]|uniref:Pre-mRNA-splicing factor CWC25 n=1 Tax=Grifola frondosa TaxID=5627 RepID=A0A1C7LWX4_GRIFR|nr:Pre-mRNA-splicing factor CWC25 [Grifola frondosa]
MKKSWHPLLLKNQERVWLEEKKALEEKKKLDQLRKEKEEERQLQELQRLQEEQTGKKRQEKLEWMYATPATGSSQNQNELEDYLLGKKRVDKMLTADENEKIGAAHKNFIAIQYANTMRDTAAKIREDPLLAIKQQEQAAYQALMSNPLRLREMQERNGIKPKKDKKSKKDKKEKHKHKRRDRSESLESDRRRSASQERYPGSRRSPSPYGRKSRSPVPSRSRYDEDRRRDDYYLSRRGRSRSRTPERYERRRSRSDDRRKDSRIDDGRTEPQSESGDDPIPPSCHEPSPGPRAPPPHNSRATDNGADDRAARLAAMSSNATSMTVERRERLSILLEREKAELQAEEQRRAKSKGMGDFLSHEQKKVFGGVGGIEERIRRGRGQMRVDAD